MRPFTSNASPPSRHLVSSVGALERECLYMGWPADPAAGKEKVARYLRDLGFTVDRPESSIDLYAALNRVRLSSWEGESEVWDRYITTRRAEVAALNGARRIVVRLKRTVFAQDGGLVSRLRVPLPFEHSAQGALSWTVNSVSSSVKHETSGEGFLDLTLSEGLPQGSVEVAYSATVYPQSATTEQDSRAAPHDGVATPFIIPDRIERTLSTIQGLESQKAKAYELWKSFHQSLLSGHVYHLEHLASGHVEGARSGWFDCVTSSWNFCALLERLGIPARVVAGLLLHRFGPSYHYWCEVLLDGAWFPLDFYSWDLSEGDESVRDRFFGNIEPRLRFECFPRVFSRFLPNLSWFMERSSEGGVGTYTYRRLESGAALAQDVWSLESCEP